MRILTVYKKNHESVHDRAFDHVRRTIEDLGLSASFRAREVVQREDVLDVDLVIVLGGDGTLTSISHIIDSETLVMGVNSHPRDEDAEGSLGFFMGSDARTFESDLDAVINGTAEVNLLPRLQAVIETTSGNRIQLGRRNFNSSSPTVPRGRPSVWVGGTASSSPWTPLCVTASTPSCAKPWCWTSPCWMSTWLPETNVP